MRLRILITIIIILSALTVHASPAKRGVMTLMQPDGTSFKAVLKGDEFTRIKTTTDGQAIMQDEDGWWCYAIYGADGTKTCTGMKVGQTASGAIPAESREIPHAALSDLARERRSVAGRMRQDDLGMMNRLKVLRTKGEETIKHGIVILAEFQDVRFTNTKADFEAMLLQPGYDRYGATGSAKEYFDDQFGGLIEFDFYVSEIVTLKGKREFYGSNKSNGDDMRPTDMIVDACTLADEEVDFSLYDDNKDGVVDNVFVFFAGEDEAEGGDENCIWSHAWYVKSGAQKTLRLDGCLIDRYACTSEMTRIYDASGRLTETHQSGIGTFCHEYSHTFGLPDMYDTDYESEGGWAAGLWSMTSLMDAGNQNNNGNTPPNFNAIERELLGLTVPEQIEKGKYSLDPINLSGRCLRMDTDAEGEYYLFECRDNTQKWDAYIGGRGMLVYHIDRKEDMIDRWDFHNTVNADASHQCADLVEADGRKDSFIDTQDFLSRNGNIKGIYFPYNDVNTLAPEGTPGLSFWSGGHSEFTLTGISLNESGGVDFSVITESEKVSPPSVNPDVRHETFSDAAIISFESNREYEGEATVCFGLTGKEADTLAVMPYESGKYALILEGLEPSRTYTVTISFILEDIEGRKKSISFMTKKKPKVDWPYIHFGTAARNTDGTFPEGARIPLKVLNASDAVQVIWTFNGREISHEGDFYHTLTHSGTLRAQIIRKDGSEDIVIKEITIAEE